MSSRSPPLLSTSRPNHTTYRIGRGETGVLTFEPYKSVLLPLWRFRTPPIARQSAQSLYERFLEYDEEDDFVGMDMCRKFIQMGMTRARRYANYAGGRKYAKRDEEDLQEVGQGGGEGRKDDGNGGDGMEGGVEEDKGGEVQRRVRGGREVRVLEKSDDHKGKQEKEEASQVFRGYWIMCREHEGYIHKKKAFQKEQREWYRERKRRQKSRASAGSASEQQLVS